MSATPKTPLLDELAARDEQVADAYQRIRDVEDAALKARQDAAWVKEELVEAFACGDEAKAATIAKTKLKADARAAEPWQERTTGAQRAAARAKTERDAWVAEHISGLLDELAPSAHAAAKAITANARGLENARREWHAVDDRVSALVSVASGGQSARTPSVEHIDHAIRDALRATVNMPAPLPEARQSAPRVIPEHDVPAGVFLRSDEKAA